LVGLLASMQIWLTRVILVAEELRGRVVAIFEGVTLTLLTEDTLQIRIRSPIWTRVNAGNLMARALNSGLAHLVSAGSLARSRIYSKYMALQIRAHEAVHDWKSAQERALSMRHTRGTMLMPATWSSAERPISSPVHPILRKQMAVKPRAEIEISRRQPAKAEPERTVAGATLTLVEPQTSPLTYGSWMELGLAARQLTAASRPMDAAVTPTRRHG
jgi:hypothetical protein